MQAQRSQAEWMRRGALCAQGPAST